MKHLDKMVGKVPSQKVGFGTGDSRREQVRDKVLSRRDLRNRDLSGLDLSREDLMWSDLRGADLRETKLCGVILFGSRLDGAVLKKADLESAVLTECSGQEADFSGSRLRNADMRGMDLTRADLSAADLSHARLSSATLSEALLDGHRVQGADFRFSRGLSAAVKDELERNGARVSRIHAGLKDGLLPLVRRPIFLIPVLLVLLGLGLLLVSHFKNPRNLGTNILERRWEEAKREKRLEDALELDRILVDKYEAQDDWWPAFEKRLDMARLYRMLGQLEASVELLGRMSDQYGRDPNLRARIAVEEALLKRDRDELPAALSHLAQVGLEGLRPGVLYSVKATLGDLYRRSGLWDEAAIVYRELARDFKADPSRRFRALRNLARVLEAGGDPAAAGLAWLEIPLKERPDPKPYVMSLLDLAEALGSKGQDKEALRVLDGLFGWVEGWPELESLVNGRRRSLECNVLNKEHRP